MDKIQIPTSAKGLQNIIDYIGLSLKVQSSEKAPQTRSWDFYFANR